MALVSAFVARWSALRPDSLFISAAFLYKFFLPCIGAGAFIAQRRITPKKPDLYRSRIAFVTLTRSPLSTLFGLSTLTVHAAGGTLSYHLLKREEAEKLAAELTEALV